MAALATCPPLTRMQLGEAPNPRPDPVIKGPRDKEVDDGQTGLFIPSTEQKIS